MRYLILLICLGFLCAGCMSLDALKVQKENYAEITDNLDKVVERVNEKVEKKEIDITEAINIIKEVNDIKVDIAEKQKETGDPWWLVAISIVGSLVGVRLRHKFPGLLTETEYLKK